MPKWVKDNEVTTVSPKRKWNLPLNDSEADLIAELVHEAWVIRSHKFGPTDPETLAANAMAIYVSRQFAKQGTEDDTSHPPTTES